MSTRLRRWPYQASMLNTLRKGPRNFLSADQADMPPRLTDTSHPSYDIAPDGRFLMMQREGAESRTIVVHNWIAQQREKTASKH